MPSSVICIWELGDQDVPPTLLYTMVSQFDNLPEGFLLIGNAAYVLTKHLLTPFTGSSKSVPLNDIYNFYLSQLCIRIEMAFGWLTTKFRIFRIPMEINLYKISKTIPVAAKLHHYIINKQISAAAPVEQNIDSVEDSHGWEYSLGYFESGDPDDDEAMVSAYVNGSSEDNEIAVVPSFGLWESILNYIQDNGLQQPSRKAVHNS
jgi:DDE superfamily endonuclease